MNKTERPCGLCQSSSKGPYEMAAWCEPCFNGLFLYKYCIIHSAYLRPYKAVRWEELDVIAIDMELYEGKPGDTKSMFSSSGRYNLLRRQDASISITTNVNWILPVQKISRVSASSIDPEIKCIEPLIPPDNIMILFTFYAILQIEVCIQDSFLLLKQLFGLCCASLWINGKTRTRRLGPETWSPLGSGFARCRCSWSLLISL